MISLEDWTRAHFIGRAPTAVDGGDGIYYSFVTLTTVRFGDITLVSPPARSRTILEALVGQRYPAVLLGRRVSLRTQGGDARRADSGQR